MATAIGAIGQFIGAAFAGTGGAFLGVAAGKGLAVANAALQLVAFTALDAVARTLLAPKTGKPSLGSREVSITSGVEPAKIIYGEVVTAGVIRFSGTSGTEEEFLWRSDVLCAHECEDITDIWVDDEKFEDGVEFTWGAGSEVTVGSGDYDGYVKFYKLLGNQSAANGDLVSAFSEITSAHAAEGHTLVEARFEWVEGSNKLWQQRGVPRDIRARVKGKKVYNPVLDTGGAGADPTNDNFKEFSSNPILIAADYMVDSRVGMGIPVSKIDWETVENEAAYCDVLVPIPTGESEKRYTCNGVLSCGTKHRDNILSILSTCTGKLSYRQGKYLILAGRFGTGANLAVGDDSTFTTSIGNWTKAPLADGSVSHNATDDTIKFTNPFSSSNPAPARARLTLSVTEGAYYCFRAVLKATSGDTSIVMYASDDPNGSGSFTGSKFVNAVGDIIEVSGIAPASTIYLFIGNTGSYFSAPLATNEADDVEIYQVATKTIDKDWLIGDPSVTLGPDRKSNRFNKVKAVYISPDQEWKRTDAIPVTDSTLLADDNNEVLTTSLVFQMTNSETEAQRLMNNCLQQSRRKRYRLPCNYKALSLAPHTKVIVNVPQIGLNNTVLKVVKWTFNDINENAGIELILEEDQQSFYSDLEEGEYSVRTANGQIVFGFQDVLPPSGLTATSKEKGILLEWNMPSLSSAYDLVQVYRSASNSRAASTLIWQGRATEYFDETNDETTYYYWVRAKKDDLFSIYNPDALTTTASAAGTLDITGNIVGTIDGTDVSEVATVASNFNTRNDRDDSTVVTAVIASDGTAIDHAEADDGSVDISFEWTWGGTQQDIDGFEVFVRSSTSSSSYNFNADGSEESIFVGPDKRAVFLYGVPSNLYYTFGIRAYRVVDDDVSTTNSFADVTGNDGIIYSFLNQPTLGSEDPYRPESNVDFKGDVSGTVSGTVTGNVTGTINGTSASTVATVATNFNNRNDRIGTAVVAPTVVGTGAAVDHALADDGSVDLSFEWNWGGTESDIDGFEVFIRSSDSALSYNFTANGTEESVFVRADKRAIFVYGVPANLYYTFGVRAYRIVDPDVDGDEIIYSTIAQPALGSEDPYQPETNVAFAGDITGTIDGVAASTVATAATNFNTRNDRDGTALISPFLNTDGSVVDHVINDDGSATISFEWSWFGTESDIDGFEIFYRSSSSSSSYNFTTAGNEESVFVNPDKRAIFITGAPANQYYTFGVRAYRIVDPDIDSAGILYSTLVQPSISSEDPYQPSSSIAFAGAITGTIAGASDAAATATSSDFSAVTGTTKPDDNATKNTGNLRADTFDMGSAWSFTSGSFANVDTWQINVNGSAPVTLVSNTFFELDEAGLYLISVSGNVAVNRQFSTGESQVSVRLQFNGSGSYVTVGFLLEATEFNNTTSGVAFNASGTFIIEAAANDRVKIVAEVDSNSDASFDGQVSILNLKQVTD